MPHQPRQACTALILYVLSSTSIAVLALDNHRTHTMLQPDTRELAQIENEVTSRSLLIIVTIYTINHLIFEIGPLFVCMAFITVSATLLASLLYAWGYLVHRSIHVSKFSVLYGALSNMLSIILLAVVSRLQPALNL